MRDLIANHIFYGFETLLIVDARFEYEHEGGHIKKSKNVRSMAQMTSMFDQFRGCEVCVVFHCEFSQNRGPNLMQRFRDHDRRENIDRYPTLDYPTIYLLQGGYCQFFEDCPDLCDGGYVRMRDPCFVSSGELKRSHSVYASGGLCENGHQRRLRRTLSDGDCAVLEPGSSGCGQRSGRAERARRAYGHVLHF
jgi:M-phase inducer tyrosine phosphatase